MTAEVRKALDMLQLERAKYAYLELREVYEEASGGIDGARQYQEYWAICSNVQHINAEIRQRKEVLDGGIDFND